MNSIGLFEAKTKLSEICEAVSNNRKAVTVTRRGKPLVTIQPIPAGQSLKRSVWAVRAEYERKHGRLEEEFELPVRAKQTWRNPLES